MKKYMSNSSILIIGILLISIGLITLIGSVTIFKDIASLVLILMILISLKDLFGFLLKKPDKKLELSKKIIGLVLVIIAYIFRDYSIAIVPLIFSLYSLMNGAVNLVSYILLKINKLKGGTRELLQAIVYIMIGIIILFKPLIHLDIVINFIAAYSILLGLSFISDYFDIKHYRKFPKIKICLPSILEAIIPISVLQNINRTINDTKEEVKYIHKKNNEKPDLEILIHVTENGYGRLGHMDMYFDNEIISFGNYDINSYKLHDTIGNGVLFIVKNRHKYLEFCVKDNKKTLFVFGLKLTDTEKNNIRNNITKIKNNLKEWNPPYLSAKKKHKSIKKDKYNDYSSRLYKKTKAKFYKFKTGKYKVFFVLGNNCASLANKIIGKSLKDSFKFYGVMTPGTYYDYLEREFMKKGSIVVSKKIYNQKNIDKTK